MKKSINPTGKFRYHPYRFSRRDFMALAGLSATGMLLRSSAFSMPLRSKSSGGSRYLTQVAVTQAEHYEQALMKQKIQHLFDSLGGISDVVGPGDRVAIKINLTGGSSWAGHPNLQGVDIREAAWTHPEVLRAVGELLIDAGVQQYLGAQRVNLNQAAPYPAFANISTGGNPFFYNSFVMNQILAEVDVCVSIPKMKHHYEAATTQSMKNHVGSVPLEFYQMPGLSGYRSAIHQEGGEVSYHLPRTICDLNLARPVNLAVIDGVLNAVGGEGPWNPTFSPAQYHYLLAGKDPVATDSIATLIMGADPEAEQLVKPNGQLCDNHLFLAQQKGLGTNLLEEIELVGDAAGTVVGVGEDGQVPAGSAVVRLYPNYPNPCRDHTTIRYYVGREERTTLWITDLSGKLLKVLEDGPLTPGEYLATWSPSGIAPGIYICRLASGNEMVSRKITVVR
jgi:uncharacterized protein (DUF362 family)